MSFPTPIGGTPFEEDFAPSILFSVLFALLIPLVLCRAFSKTSRNFLLINAALFVIERPVVYSLRATISHNAHKRESHGLLLYMQMSFTLGSLSIVQDVAKLLRTILVNSTYPRSSSSTEGQSSSNLVLEEGELEDRPRARFWARRAGDFTALMLLIPTFVGVAAGVQYPKTIDNESKGNLVMRLRYVSAAFIVLLEIFILAQCIFAFVYKPRVNKKALKLLMIFTILLMSPPIYRLCTMHNRISSLQSRGPGSLSEPSAKATFFVFHVLPELIASALYFGLNIRQTFDTGLAGDVRHRDETPEEKEKRLKKEAERAARNAA